MGPTKPQILFADGKGNIRPFDGLVGCGMKAGRFFELDPDELVPLPESSELFVLPGRAPVGLHPVTGEPVILDADPYDTDRRPCQAVAAFIPPGYALTYHAAYTASESAPLLPLFAYGACVYHRGRFHVSGFRVDRAIRHDERFMDPASLLEGVARFKKEFPANRLVPHLEGCATVNGCANAKNFFLERFECPVPTSPVCNAQCQGCISFQPEDRTIPSPQQRIRFVPSPEEIAELALHHINRVADPIVSFGQGCEGEPTLSGVVIEAAIRLIRQKTSKGSLNLNTNASRPAVIARLFDAGLDSIRVSTNSVREPYYSRYYQPRGYGFGDVRDSILEAKKRGGFVSLNYLSMPGFTDSEGEAAALESFVAECGVDMIQWRNLNYDPIRYFEDLGFDTDGVKWLGMKALVERLGRRYPRLMMGYFNPEKKRIQRRKKETV